MKILAIETSCDETAISLFTANETDTGVDFNVLSNITHSQVEMHVQYGGVFPQLAKREHQRNLVPILLKTLGMDMVERRK
jgi:N6-L-threonylcarbamoyladenine synthase